MISVGGLWRSVFGWERRRKLMAFITGDDAPLSVLLLQVLGAFAQFQRMIIREAQREGIAIAKRNGGVQRAQEGADHRKCGDCAAAHQRR